MGGCGSLYSNIQVITLGEIQMWVKPAYTDLRIGFEVTMYFHNR